MKLCRTYFFTQLNLPPIALPLHPIFIFRMYIPVGCYMMKSSGSPILAYQNHVKGKLQHILLDPISKIFESVGLGGIWEYALLTRFQVLWLLLLAHGPHLENYRCSLRPKGICVRITWGSGLREKMPDDVLLASQWAVVLNAETPDRFSNASQCYM